MIYWLYLFFISAPTKSNKKFSKGVSVLICAHNELDNLKNFLSLFTDQNYPSFEIILVNDRSTDKSKNYLDNLSHPNLTVLHIDKTPNGWNSKKWALSKGAEVAKYDHLLLSDADCYPTSNDWIQSMSNGFDYGQAVIGYSGYENSNGLLNKFIQYETYLTAASYLGLTNKKIRYMAVGRNFGIEKKIYQEFNFGKFKHIQGGDDDLIINYLKPTSTAIYNHTSHTTSIPKYSVKEYIRQKTRHINVSNHYSLKSKIIIGLFNLSNLLFYILFILLFILNFNTLTAIGLFVLRTSVLFYNFTKGSIQLKVKLNSIYLILLDFMYTIFLWTIGPIALIAKKIRWK